MMTDVAKIPGFLIIGAQKCGTTWLHRRLGEHPEIFMPEGKELEFFSYETHLKSPGFEHYLAHFKGTSATVTGEATASYFWSSGASQWCNQPGGFQSHIPQVVRQYLGPELKIIIGLRDPVERALSAFAHYLAHGELAIDTSFTNAAGYGGIIDIGFYGHHLQSWLEYFPREQMIILDLDKDIGNQPVETLRRLHHFLGVSRLYYKHQDVSGVVFPGLKRTTTAQRSRVISLPEGLGEKVISAQTIDWLEDCYESDKTLLRQLVGQNFSADWLP